LHHALIFNDDAWKQIKIVVTIEDPLQRMLRLTDSDEPSLMQIARLHEKAYKDIEAFLQGLQREYNDTPELYPHMFNPVGVWTVLQQKLNVRLLDCENNNLT
jgi:hypothetical protein